MIDYKDKKLEKNAFIHRSYLNETTEPLTSNERLEFLGDAVLELLVSQFLYTNFPSSEEGKLTALRSSIVRTEALAKAALRLEFDKKLFLSRGEEKTGGRKNPSLLADVFEAYIGALFLDQGLEIARNFVYDNLFIYLPAIIKNKSYRDAKSFLQEQIQEKEKVSPTYKVLKEIGPDHRKMFTIGVFVKDQKIGEGSGKSKQEAEEKAAKSALESAGLV